MASIENINSRLLLLPFSPVGPSCVLQMTVASDHQIDAQGASTRHPVRSSRFRSSMTLDDREQLAVGSRTVSQGACTHCRYHFHDPAIFLPSGSVLDDDARRQLDVLASFVELPDTLTPNQLMIQRVAETSQRCYSLDAAAHLLDLLLAPSRCTLVPAFTLRLFLIDARFFVFLYSCWLAMRAGAAWSVDGRCHRDHR